MDLVVPQSFRDMPRWWHGGQQWLDELPALVREQCRRRRLTVSGDPTHGSNALVVPVTRARADFVLRLTPPGREVAEQVAALRFWDGRGTVGLIEADAEAGVMLSERLTIGASLRDEPVAEAMPVLGRMMSRLAMSAPRGDIAYDLARMLWTRLDEMADAAEIVRNFDRVVTAAGIERDHGRDWVLFRAVGYWLWGLGAGLTEDPERCRRLVAAFEG